ncbi:MAG TPA: HupE/UreJ family protein [Burkholderiales bacterium]|nr:HupE/UreJ family protein [Burkholderiales bacterium]
MSLPGTVRIRLFVRPQLPAGPVARALLALFALVMGVSVAHAHPGTTGFATLTLGEQGLRYELVLDPEALSDWSPPATSVDVDGMQSLVAAVAQNLKIFANRTACELQRPEFATESPGRPATRIVLTFACVSEPGTISVRDDLPDVLGNAHHTLTLFIWPGGSGRFTFDADRREVHVDLASGTISERSVDPASIGFRRVLLGPDYLLFALCLLLVNGRSRNVVGLLAACVICQGITFTIAATGLFVLPVRAGETLAALAVACLAATIVFRRGDTSRYGWIAASAFGLIQGIAAWPVLADAVLTSAVAPGGLAEYAFGVAAAQVALLLPLPVALRLRGVPGYPQASTAASAVVLVASLGLAVSRLLF